MYGVETDRIRRCDGEFQRGLGELEALGNGAGDNPFGVRLGEIRKLAKTIKSNHELALELWATENIDARLLGILLMKPKQLSADELDHLVRSVAFMQVVDWLNAEFVKKHSEKEALRET